LATTRNFKPDVDFLVAAKRSQISGQSSLETEQNWSFELYTVKVTILYFCNLYYLLLLLHFVISKSTAACRLSDILLCGPHPQMSLRPLIYGIPINIFITKCLFVYSGLYKTNSIYEQNPSDKTDITSQPKSRHTKWQWTNCILEQSFTG